MQKVRYEIFLVEIKIKILENSLKVKFGLLIV